VQIDREELCRRVRKPPVFKLDKEFDISDVGRGLLVQGSAREDGAGTYAAAIADEAGRNRRAATQERFPAGGYDAISRTLQSQSDRRRCRCISLPSPRPPRLNQMGSRFIKNRRKTPSFMAGI